MSVNMPCGAIASGATESTTDTTIEDRAWAAASAAFAIEDRVWAAASAALSSSAATDDFSSIFDELDGDFIKEMLSTPLPDATATASSQMPCLSPLLDGDLPLTPLLTQEAEEVGSIFDQPQAALKRKRHDDMDDEGKPHPSNHLSAASQLRRLEGHITSFSGPFPSVFASIPPALPHAASAPAPFGSAQSRPSHEESMLPTASIDSPPLLFGAALSTPAQMADGSPSLEKHTLTNPKLRQCLAWTPEDEALLLSYSSVNEAKNARGLRHYGKIAIGKKWKDLQRLAKMDPLRAAVGEHWSQEELQALQDSPTLEDALNSPKLQRRSPYAIKDQWQKLHTATASSNTSSLSPLSDDDIPLTPLLTQETEEVGSISDKPQAVLKRKRFDDMDDKGKPHPSNHLSAASQIRWLEGHITSFSVPFPSVFASMPPALPHAASAPAPFGSAQSRPSHEESVLPREPSSAKNTLSTTPKNMIGKRWTQEELRALNRHSTLKDALKDPDLKDRLEDAIRRKWLELHPEDKQTSGLPWTPQDDAMVCSYKSAQEAQKSPELLSRRTATAILWRWRLLKILAKKA